MLEMFVGKATRGNKRKGILKEAAEYFTKPTEELEAEIRQHLGTTEEDYFIKVW